MKISIIIPIYNVDPYLRKCVDSLLMQDIQDYEIILVNDGSTDNTLEVANTYAEDAFRSYPKLLTLVYYRIIDNLEGKEKLKYFIKFAKKIPIHFGVKYLFVHLPNIILKNITKR